MRGSCVGVSSWLALQPKLSLGLFEGRSCVGSDGCVLLTGEVICDAHHEPADKWAFSVRVFLQEKVGGVVWCGVVWWCGGGEAVV